MMNRVIRQSLVLALVLSSALGFTSTAHAAPSAPTGVTVVDNSAANATVESASVTVSWAIDNATIASIVTVTRLSDSLEIDSSTITSPASQTGFENLTGGENYAFVVTAIDINGDTASAAAVNFVALSAPAVPTNLAATAGIGSATLTWTPPSNNGGLALETYTITSASLTETQSAAITPSGSDTSVVVTGLTAGTPYVFKIRATNSNGYSSEAIFPSITTPTSPEAPVAPTTSVSGSSVTVSWTAPGTGGSSITSYEIYSYSTGAGTPLIQTDTATASDTSKVITLAPGTYTVKIAALNAVGLGTKSDPSSPFNIAAVSAPNISITGSPVTAYVGESITSYSISNSGGIADSYTISVSSPSSLPFSSIGGLQFDAGTGLISGTPTGPLTAETFTVTAVNTSGNSSATFSITIRDVLSTSQDSATVTLTKNRAVTSFRPVSASGGHLPYTYSVTTLPAGLSINPATGFISGTPTETWTAKIETVTVTDSNSVTSERTFTLTVNPPVATSVDTATVILTKDAAMSPAKPVSATGGTSPLTYAITPTLPSGLSFSTSTGQITGTPIAVLSDRTETVTVTDANGSSSASTFVLRINGPLSTTQDSATVAVTVGRSTSFKPVSGAGGDSPLTYSISPTLPAGLTFDTATGTISGTASGALSATVETVTVTDAASATSSKTFVLTVNAAVSTSIDSATVSIFTGSTLSGSGIRPVSAAGGTTPLAFSITPALANGLSFNAATGYITGTASGTLISTVETVTVTDANGSTSSKSFTLEVKPNVVSLFAISGVTPPVSGATPVTTVSSTAEYTGTVSWSPAVVSTFAASTVYTATITLTANSGYTFTGVAADSFTVTGSTTDTNTANSGIVYAVFPATAAAPNVVIAAPAIAGVTIPVRGATPTATLASTDSYTATISWSPSDSTFAASTAYTATITLTAKAGYTLTGVAANFFTVSGAVATNSANSGVITAIFPATEAAPVDPGPVTPTPTPVTPAPVVTSPTEPATLTTNPNSATSVVLVIPGLSTYTAKPITVLVPAGASTTALTIKIAPTATSADATVGYISIDVTALSGSTAVTTFAQPLQITIPAGPVGSTISWSNDGLTWITIPQLTSAALASGQTDGFYVNSDGTISIFTRHLTQFGFKRAQSALVISPSASTIQIGKKSQLTITAGSGSGAISYATSTSNICSVNASGEVTAIAAGTCQITVTKAASGIYTKITGGTLLTVSDSDQKAAAAAAEAAAQAAANAAAKAQAIAAKNSIKIAKIAKNSWKISVDMADSKSGMMVEILIGEKMGKKVVYKKVASGTLSSTATLTRSIKANLSTGSIIKVVSDGKSLFTRTL